MRKASQPALDIAPLLEKSGAYETIIQKLFHNHYQHASIIDRLSIVQDTLLCFGDVTGAYFLAAMEKLDDYIEDFYSKDPSYYLDGIGMGRHFGSSDKREITINGMWANTLQFKTPAIISKNCSLLPNTVYFGKMLRCPLSDSWGAYEQHATDDYTSKNFHIPVEVAQVFAVYDNHPAWLRYFRDSFRNPHPFTVESDGRAWVVQGFNVQIPLSWVTHEYDRFDRQQGGDCFVQKKIPTSQEEWKSILYWHNRPESFAVTEDGLYRKLIFTSELFRRFRWSDYICKDVCNLWQDTRDNVNDPVALAMLKPEPPAIVVPAPVPVVEPTPVQKKESPEIVPKKADSPVYTLDRWDNLKKEDLQKLVNVKIFRNIAKKYGVSVLDVQRKCIAWGIVSKQPYCEFLVKKMKKHPISI